MTKNEEKVRREVYLLLFLCIKLTYKGLDIVSKPTIDDHERHKEAEKEGYGILSHPA
ncbi:MAG: hypothetical protein HXN40_05630 [Prevotella histicola]|uniref:hypothetical protein n=1 Tax=Prevotella histicola TaxID=470565 RepID=UPI001CADE9BB|nr:hypothetical protein [Prevotella histicola]MBF1412062.1 hypothetical protein [Prevotella histicola]MBF1423051.1 hypothetical protein [Prevotella histicola]